MLKIRRPRPAMVPAPALSWRADPDSAIVQRALLHRQRDPRLQPEPLWRAIAGGFLFWLLMIGPVLAYVWWLLG
jgi:hypothetical protein